MGRRPTPDTRLRGILRRTAEVAGRKRRSGRGRGGPRLLVDREPVGRLTERVTRRSVREGPPLTTPDLVVGNEGVGPRGQFRLRPVDTGVRNVLAWVPPVSTRGTPLYPSPLRSRAGIFSVRDTQPVSPFGPRCPWSGR